MESFGISVQQMLEYCKTLQLFDSSYLLIIVLGIFSIIDIGCWKLNKFERYWKGTSEQKKRLSSSTEFIAVGFFVFAFYVNLHHAHKIVKFSFAYPKETAAMLEISKNDPNLQALNGMLTGYRFIELDSEKKYNELNFINDMLGLSNVAVFYPERLREILSEFHKNEKKARSAEENRIFDYLFFVMPLPLVFLYFVLMACIVRALLLSSGILYYNHKARLE